MFGRIVSCYSTFDRACSNHQLHYLEKPSARLALSHCRCLPPSRNSVLLSRFSLKSGHVCALTSGERKKRSFFKRNKSYCRKVKSRDGPEHLLHRSDSTTTSHMCSFGCVNTRWVSCEVVPLGKAELGKYCYLLGPSMLNSG